MPRETEKKSQSSLSLIRWSASGLLFASSLVSTVFADRIIDNISSGLPNTFKDSIWAINLGETKQPGLKGLTLGQEFKPISPNPNIPESMPSNILDWELRAFGNIHPNGYWTTHTAFEIKEDGKFVIENRREKEIFLKRSSEKKAETRIDFVGTFPYIPDQEFSLKIPIQGGTSLTHLSVYSNENIDLNNLQETLKTPHYKTYLLKDGSVELEILKNDSLKNIPFIKIEGTVEPTQIPQIKPSSVKNSALNSHALKPEIKKSLDLITDNIPTNSQRLEALLNSANRPQLYYSLSPNNAEILREINNREDYVNFVQNMEATDLTVKNAVLVHLSNFYSNTTLAFGYVPFGTSFNNGLYRIARAGYALNDSGKAQTYMILDFKDDELTKAYKKLITEKSTTPFVTPWEKYRQEREEIQSKAEKLRLGGAFGVLLSTGLALNYYYKRRENILKQSIQNADTGSNGLSPNDQLSAKPIEHRKEVKQWMERYKVKEILDEILERFEIGEINKIELGYYYFHYFSVVEPETRYNGYIRDLYPHPTVYIETGNYSPLLSGFKINMYMQLPEDLDSREKTLAYWINPQNRDDRSLIVEISFPNPISYNPFTFGHLVDRVFRKRIIVPTLKISPEEFKKSIDELIDLLINSNQTPKVIEQQWKELINKLKAEGKIIELSSPEDE